MGQPQLHISKMFNTKKKKKKIFLDFQNFMTKNKKTHIVLNEQNAKTMHNSAELSYRGYTNKIYQFLH